MYNTNPVNREFAHPAHLIRLETIGRVIALTGVVLPLLMIGLLKFTQIEIEALKPLISGTPWLAWLYAAFGEAGASYLLGVVEIFTAVLLIVSPWSARAAIVGGLLGAATFAVTVSTMFALPTWEGGEFPLLNALGSFLIKDVALLGVSLLILADGVRRFLGSRNLVI